MNVAEDNAKPPISDPRLDQVRILCGDGLEPITLRQMLRMRMYKEIQVWFLARLMTYKLGWPAERQPKLNEQMVSGMLDLLEEHHIALDLF